MSLVVISASGRERAARSTGFNHMMDGIIYYLVDAGKCEKKIIIYMSTTNIRNYGFVVVHV